MLRAKWYALSAFGPRCPALRRDPLVDPAVEHRQRLRPVGDDEVVERLHVEFWPQSGFGLVTELHDLEHADLIAGRLAWKRNVAPDLGTRLVGRQAARVDHVIDRLVLGPAERMNAGIDHQARRPEMLLVQMHE